MLTSALKSVQFCICRPQQLLFNQSLLMPSQSALRNFSTGKKVMFGTDSPSESSKYHRGLFHSKKHAQRRQRCFSMKYSLQTMKPNTTRRFIHSDILGMSFQMWISMKARRCIMKAGSLDKYLLNTNPDVIDSRFGLHLRNLIIRKQREGKSFMMPYVPGQAKVSRTHTTKRWEYRATPSVYMPANVRVAEDHSKYYVKTPQEMSRFEIADLERTLRLLNEPDDAKFQNNEEEEATALIDDEDERFKLLMETEPEFAEYNRQLKLLLPVRLSTIRMYFNKYKYQKKKREEILAAAEATEPFLKKALGPDYQHFTEGVPEIGEFLKELAAKQSKEAQEQAQLAQDAQKAQDSFDAAALMRKHAYDAKVKKGLMQGSK